MSIDSSVAEAELKLCAFIAEHDISFLVIDHLTDLLKECSPDSKIAGEIKLKKTKCTAIIKNVIADSHKQELADKIKSEKFSVLVDESTDISTIKTMCILVTFYDKNIELIVTSLWSLAPIFGENDDFEAASRGATAESSFCTIIKSFKLKVSH